MKKVVVILLAAMTAIITAGCVSLPMKVHDSLPKVNTIFLGEVSVFKGMDLAMSGIKDIGKPTDDPYYREVAKEYTTALEKELTKRGFVLVPEPTPQSLVIKTKIGDQSPFLGGWMMGMGTVGAQVEVYQNGKLLLYFEKAVNTTNPKFLEGSILGGRAKDQIKRHIAPRVAEQLKKLFL